MHLIKNWSMVDVPIGGKPVSSASELTDILTWNCYMLERKEVDNSRCIHILYNQYTYKDVFEQYELRYSLKASPLEPVTKITKGLKENCILRVGGFGKVYRVDILDGSEIAIKRVYLMVQNKECKSRFQKFATVGRLGNMKLVQLCGYYKHEISDEDERAVYGGNWYRDVYKETCLFLKHVVGTFFMKSLKMGCSLALSLVGAVAHEFMVLHLAMNQTTRQTPHTAAEPSLQNRVASSASFRSVKMPAISSNGDLVVEHVNMILYELFHSLRPPKTSAQDIALLLSF
ncbi:hypothetical protein IGI04_023071 [Brassica rapa subsp. trilocularis]|uniref:Protein kinase domain-containing protein n=1 Tax=Brassica rapa subsp. trilocularis TaxID=1813537 RepID=A0ABQ7M2S2_BRACM|nr:hypothetical protein IGI04_023071 [Brassica rapa subsp. trilocularis]